MQTCELERYVKEQIQKSPKLSILDAKDSLCFSVTGLNEEAGEVAGLLCREIYKKEDMLQSEWISELGDAMWYLVAATIAKGLTLEDLYRYNFAKLEKRYGHEREAE